MDEASEPEGLLEEKMGGGVIRAFGCFYWIIEFWSCLCNRVAM